MPNLPVDFAYLILAFIAIIATLLYLWEYRKRTKLKSEEDKFLQNIKQKGWENLQSSIKQSQAILTEAELEGIKLVAGNKIELSKLDQEYAAKFSQSLNESKQAIFAAQNQFFQFMQDLQKRGSEFEEASRKTAEVRINQLFDRIEARLADFLVQTEQKTTSSIELELRAARQLIDTYRTQQLKLIDENIIAMMEQTLNMVLGKKLSLEDQLDLVYESLEKAKVEKFIV